MRDKPAFKVEGTTVDALRDQLPAVAELVVTAVIAEVPSYADAWDGPMGATIAEAVRLALAGFLHLIAGGERDAGTPMQPAVDGAYALGRGEARSGRTMDALLAAYRVGARVAWREMSATAVTAKLPADHVARFAEVVFAYIDELSAASVAGHSDELATSGRVRLRYLERLGLDLLAGAEEPTVVAEAERADWTPPECLVAVLLPSSQVRAALSGLDPRTLEITDDADGWTVLLIPSTGTAARQYLIRHFDGRRAVVGPERHWLEVSTSYRRASRIRALVGSDALPVVDSEAHLAQLICTADPEAAADLRTQALAPLAGLPAATAERLAETLRSWLLHQGRRDVVAAHLMVHPQTVRYRMTQVRDLFGDALLDPHTIRDLVIALAPGVRLADPTPI